MSIDVKALLCRKSALFLVVLSAPLHSEEIITITADRIKSDLKKSPNEVVVFSESDLQKTGSKNISDLLSSQSDLVLTTSGAVGSNTSMFLRGTDSSHTLVIIDGITMNDPSNPNRLFDFSKLSVNNIEKIEILKGAQGLIYGSNAIGGVIVITTKKAKKDSNQASTFAEVGSFKTVNTGFNLQQGLALANLTFAADYFSTQGFSAANSNSNPNAEKDGSQRLNFQLGLNRDLPLGFKVETQIRYLNQTSDLDKGGGPGADDPNDQLREEELHSKIEVSKIWDKEQAESTLSFTNSRHHRIYDEKWDSVHTTMSWYKSYGEISTINLNHTHFLSETLTQNINLEFYQEKDQAFNQNQNFSLSAYHQYEKENNLVNFGLRVDQNKLFKDAYTYKLAVGHRFNQSLLKLSVSTGFKAPSLNQLFDPQYGNSKLTPERSESLEIGLNHDFSKEVKLTTSLFATNFKDRFSYDPLTFINRNAGEASILGIEQKMDINWHPSLDHQISFTALKTKDKSTGDKLPRRPSINIKNQIAYKFSDKNSFTFDSTYCGDRMDVDNNGLPVRMNNYLIHDISYRFDLNQDVYAYARVKNIFDTEYEQLYGYATGGRSFLVGTQFQY